MVFPVVMYGCESWDYKETWAPKNWCFWTVVLEKTLESSLDCKPVHPKGNWSWIFTGRTDAEAETPILWPLDVKNWLTGKNPVGKTKGGRRGRQKRWLDRGDGWMASPTQWTWVWISSRNWWWTGKPGLLLPMGSQRADMTERLNWTELKWFKLPQGCDYLWASP